MSTINAVPDDLGIVTGEAVALEVRATSWPLRALGALIDFLIELGLFLALMFGVGLLATALGVDDALNRALVIVDLVVCFVLLPTILETATRGRSVGKLAVGARIVRDDGGAIGVRHAFIRALMGVPEIVFTAGGLAAVVGLLNRRSKRLGDLLAGTVSQQERVPRPPSNAVGVPASLEEWAAIADVARLPDRLSRRIAAFLARAPRMLPESRRRTAEELAAEAAPFIAPAVETEPELLLAAVAAIRRQREYTALLLEQQRFQELQQSLPAAPHGFPDR
ncbi:RDD family protein [Amnibacterium endophyticum]|uniref:RDD family protein n=1 Tax=Amnibacterium endophyticum TaxID=2109337 RepID=A0ABW4LDR6_9MICO